MDSYGEGVYRDYTTEASYGRRPSTEPKRPSTGPVPRRPSIPAEPRISIRTGDGSSEDPHGNGGASNARSTASNRTDRSPVAAAIGGDALLQLRHPKGPNCFVLLARKVVENKYFVGLTTVLTIWALTGDDVRIIFTQKPADFAFDYLVILCIVVFSIEIVLSSVGKDDYFGGFFFWLDAASTLTLVLDVQAVSLWISQLGGTGSGGAGDVRSGRTARLGAKAGRVVRVLRLVRILKLYKAYYEARQEAKRRERDAQMKGALKSPGEEDDWDETDYAEAADRDKADLEEESRVGKRLSEVTTRRTICLILAMLLVLPQLQSEVADQCPFSTEIGADFVHQSFQEWLSAPPPKAARARSAYEHAILQYIYYHNWYAGLDDTKYCSSQHCASDFYGHVFWVGVMGRNTTAVDSISALASISTAVVDEWETSNGPKDRIYNYGTMPAQAKASLGSPWKVNCPTADYARQGVSLISEVVPGELVATIKCPDDMRLSEAVKYAPRMISDAQYQDWHLAFYFDVRGYLQADSWFSLGVTFAVLVLLVVGSLMFSHDANRLVLNPVEKMIKRVQVIRDNPIYAIKMADEEFKAEQVALAKRRRRRGDILMYCFQQIVTCEFLNDKSAEPMETVILEKSIIKLGSLLALGFGEAGANIITHNMQGDGSAGVNAMVPGTCVGCIIGVVRVRDFSTATEVLQSRIMTFVNQIAEIVHGVANEFHGAPNKNNGDMFLVIWRFLAQRPDDQFNANRPEDYNRDKRFAELAVVAFSKILGGLHRSALLAGYRGHPGLQYRLGSDNRVNLSFGLHAGWAIEGAVGSEYKIDASYLSPNVSIATSVEHATRSYGVSFVVAESVVKLCTRAMFSKFRLIDRVIITGSQKPMDLYSVDLDYRSVPVDNADPLQLAWNTRNRFRARQYMETEKALKLRENYDVSAAFDEDPAIIVMRRRYTVEFFQLFNMGYQNYAQGEWQVARRMLSCTKVLLGVEDGPSTALLKYMEAPFQFEAPKDWQGVRDMDRGH